MPSSSPTSLRRRLLLQGAMLIGISLLAAGLLVWHVRALHQSFGSAIQGYAQLRQTYDAGARLALAREYLSQPNLPRAAESMRLAALLLEQPPYAEAPATPVLPPDRPRYLSCAANLRQAAAALTSDEPQSVTAAQTAANAVTGELANLSSHIRQRILADQQRGNDIQHRTLLVVVVYAAAITVLIAFGALWQYRTIMPPLNALLRGTRDFAAGRFATRLPLDGPLELSRLAGEFNQMAQQLQTLYNDLEAQVQAKSHELVQSERLASVGYLAAGVAHEINNPLGIIAGYSERASRLLQQPLETTSLPRLREAADIIRDEAYRCKTITDGLLSLARPGGAAMSEVTLEPLVAEVIKTLGGLPAYAQRQVKLGAAEKGLAAKVRAGEIKQVVLNLLLNALDATDPQQGHVEVKLSRSGEWVQLCVQDDGQGMEASTAQRVFEPFFTQKTQRRGTGLGLSISHAIVREHGGRLQAHSAGLGKGSEFVVELPASKKVAANA